MGMDISGVAPTDEVGRYIRFSVWGWRPMAEYIRTVAPELADKVEYLDTNDGDGLDAEDSVALADVFDAELASGDAARYIAERNAELAALPDDECRYCVGTPGVRHWPERDGIPAHDKPCNVCGHNGPERFGKVRPWGTSYMMELDDIARMAGFLRTCGGFEIY